MLKMILLLFVFYFIYFFIYYFNQIAQEDLSFLENEKGYLFYLLLSYLIFKMFFFDTICKSISYSII